MRKIIIVSVSILLSALICSAQEKESPPVTPKPNKNKTIVINVSDTIVFDGKDATVITADQASNIKSLLNGDYIKEEEPLQVLTKNKIEDEIILPSLIVLSILFIALLIFIIIDKKKRRDEVLYILTGRKRDSELPRLKEWKDDIAESAAFKVEQKQSTNAKPNSSELDIKSSINDLRKRIAMLEDNSRKNKVEEPKPPRQERLEIIAKPVPTPKTLYADTIINGVFNRITEQPNEDTVYELLLQSSTDRSATFTIYENAYARVLKNNDFIEGCDKQRVNSQATNLDVENGKAQLQDDDTWKIIQKAKVKFV